MPEYTIEKRGHILHLTLMADLTASVVPGLQGALRAALGADVTEVVADLSQTAMLDSSGIGLLIATSNALAKRGGRIRVVNVAPDILQLLQSMRLTARLNTSGR